MQLFDRSAYKTVACSLTNICSSAPSSYPELFSKSDQPFMYGPLYAPLTYSLKDMITSNATSESTKVDLKSMSIEYNSPVKQMVLSIILFFLALVIY